MPFWSGSGLRDSISQRLNLIFPLLIVSAVLVLVVPMPPVLLDLLLTANITLAVVILLTTISVGNPLEFSAFPAILLGTTLARLVLNVASTRLILTRAADHGTNAAGGLVDAFGDFVTAGSPTVGLIIFIILIAIQFLVITRGATRISEVAARFALDGMPGRQMAVDADLSNGLISREEAIQRRNDIARHADFYGAMDGASKFVRGDAVAGIVITLVNILGGLFIGVVQEGLDFAQAIQVFTTLTIGDGLVSQLPAFLIAIAAGMIVTRSSAKQDFSHEVAGQLLGDARVLWVAAAFLAVLAVTGLPTVPLLGLAVACSVVALLIPATEPEPEPTPEPEPAAPPKAAAPKAPQPGDQLRLEPLELELGIGLIRLADPSSGGDLLQRVTRVRGQIAQDLGFLLPKVRIRDNLQLDPRTYRIKLREVPVADGTAYQDAWLAVGSDDASLTGIAADDPATGRPGRWIASDEREHARELGCDVHDPQAVMTRHLESIVRAHSAELLTLQHVHDLLENLKRQAAHTVEQLIPDIMTTAQVHRVLCNLLREQVPIRDLETIVETLAVAAPIVASLDEATEQVRLALARTITQRYRDHEGTLHVMPLDEELESMLLDRSRQLPAGSESIFTAEERTALKEAVAERMQRQERSGRTQCLVCDPQLRAALSRLLRGQSPSVPVLSRTELAGEPRIRIHAAVQLNTESIPVA
ncbi:Flagellar biosynthesis protein FlhA [Maioricimonas rarisocia]|uniref:Flagellar biosynthesis protein FlhA n=1 Tax=Maioricimonas rarisocia TaxID=2528026 RepID=A0A517ZF71_9PLAN|nr:flagellar biosynthesis protein FlhA [Maioricimonas rarisocia]QDU41106.1 Flagellar biosynthesis protein FlhA [Maioricimonas rarisocia]